MLKRNIGIGCVNNQMLLLVRRSARGGQVTPEADKLRQRRTSYARGGQVTPKAHKSNNGSGFLIRGFAKPALGGCHINRKIV